MLADFGSISVSNARSLRNCLSCLWCAVALRRYATQVPNRPTDKRQDVIVISREEAVRLLDKLCDCARVRCRVGISLLGLWIERKLRREGDMVFLESPGLALDLRLTDAMGFEYAEPRNVLGRESAEGILSGLAIALPLRLPVLTETLQPPRDKILFFELDD